MTSMNSKESIKELISTNHTEKAINTLLESKVFKLKKEEINEIILIKSRLANYKKGNRLNIENKEFQAVELNKINLALLQIVDNIDGKESSPSILCKFKSYTIGIIAFIIFFMGVFFLISRIDILEEMIKGTKNIEYAQLIYPFFLIMIGLILSIKNIKK